MSGVKERIYRAWEERRRGEYLETRIQIAFRLDVDGNVLDANVRGGRDSVAARHFAEVVASSGPFPRMARDVACLANLELMATFSDPPHRR